MMMMREKRENKKGEIHRLISKKMPEIHQDALDKVTIEIPDDTTPAEMEKCVNNEEDDKDEIKADNEDEGIIHRVSTEQKKENNRDTLDKVIG